MHPTSSWDSIEKNRLSKSPAMTTLSWARIFWTHALELISLSAPKYAPCWRGLRRTQGLVPGGTTTTDESWWWHKGSHRRQRLTRWSRLESRLVGTVECKSNLEVTRMILQKQIALFYCPARLEFFQKLHQPEVVQCRYRSVVVINLLYWHFWCLCQNKVVGCIVENIP